MDNELKKEIRKQIREIGLGHSIKADIEAKRINSRDLTDLEALDEVYHDIIKRVI